MKLYPTIGLEIHAELLTKSKVFCTCSAEFGGEPNSRCCPVCSGLPGTLPVLNQRAVEYIVKAGCVMNCDISRFTKWDRKNYFYPDLPKAYQISQMPRPVCLGGYVDIVSEGQEKRIRINRIHLEEDAGKLVHDDQTKETLADYNRCGIPLIEIVTEPDFHSAADVTAFVEKIRLLLQYAGICDGKMEQGSLRCDVNISLAEKDAKELGTRAEIKNINSVRAIGRAIEYEIYRQTELIEAGEKVIQETRRYVDANNETYAMRSKEDAQDYRYFPDPDLIAVEIDDAWLEKIRSEIPELPVSRYERYLNEYGMTAMEARQLSDSFAKATMLDEAAASGKVKPKAVANWILSDVSKYLNDTEKELEDTALTADKLVDLISLIDSGTISGNAGKKVLVQLFETDETAEQIVERLGLKQVSDEGAILAIVQEVLAKNEKAVNDFKAGKNVTGFLVGQCMKASKGQGNPQLINKLLAAELAKL